MRNKHAKISKTETWLLKILKLITQNKEKIIPLFRKIKNKKMNKFNITHKAVLPDDSTLIK